jgi:hypothetical protein
MTRRHAAILALGLCASPAFAASDAGAPGGNGALSASGAVRFVVNVPRVLQMKMLEHPSFVLVTEADIARGEIVVRGPRLDILSNQRNGFLLKVQLLNRAFSGMRLTGLAREVDAEGEASVTSLPSMVGQARSEPRSVEYRLRLAEDAAPGQYAWPVSLTIQDP